MADLQIPDENWLTLEALAALRLIGNPHAAKKRVTVILLATAAASDTPMARVFEDQRACAERIWYQKWQDVPEIKEALRLCTAAALDSRDAETARIEGQALHERRRAIAEGSVDAVTGLRMTALQTRARDGTEASKVLLRLVDKDLAERLSEEAAIPIRAENSGEIVLRWPEQAIDESTVKESGD